VALGKVARAGQTSSFYKGEIMALTAENGLEDFRQDVRRWITANCPPEMCKPIVSENDLCWAGRHFVFTSHAQRKWLDAMASKGWTAPTWPVRHGGGGLSEDEAKILADELDRAGARAPLSSLGVWMLGPALLRFGTEEQKLEHLPKIARGEIRWCQGYSEPGAGSDLASLRTRAEDRGDHYLVNGQKIWTSHGDKADWIFCLVRTDFNAPKHRGISFLLFDMQTPGITARPIQLISGTSHFTETFFDDVRVPKQNLVGLENHGWEIAKVLLGHERELIGALRFKAAETETIVQSAIRQIGLSNGVLADPMLRAELAALEMNAAALALTAERARQEESAGLGNATMASVQKYIGSEMNKRRARLAVSIGGTDALDWEGDASGGGAAVRAWLRSYGGAIAGGTSEIQLNIIAKRQLGLPGT